VVRINFKKWIVVFGQVIFIAFAQTQLSFTEEDPRIPIELSGEERQAALAEMRLFLESIDGIMRGLAERDYLAAATWARKSGMVVPRELSGKHPQIILKLPLKVKLAGLSVHAAFDQLADSIMQKQELEKTLADLSRITSKCILCHDQYRFPTGPH
jgi:methyl coenzyme M reductase subunit C-like uncharacterized protein (methanogenesis marker protein 7)